MPTPPERITGIRSFAINPPDRRKRGRIYFSVIVFGSRTRFFRKINLSPFSSIRRIHGTRPDPRHSSGGVGTRLWPLSREGYPQQLL
ncbi:MAG: hypothetical protein E2O64_01175, partial [Gammaproteobacteria bacterium]